MTQQGIGILGGTFDPIHNGHIQIAETVLKSLGLERIEFIPCFQPPHRDQPIASPSQRLSMVKLALIHHPEFAVNDIEIKREGISYTIDTLQSLQKQFPDNYYFYIVGADVFAHFETWHEWEKIIAITNIVVVSRHDQEIKMPQKIKEYSEKNKLKNHIHFCTMTPIEISATQIRADIAAKKEKINGLPRLVQEYILKNDIYHAC